MARIMRENLENCNQKYRSITVCDVDVISSTQPKERYYAGNCP